MPLHNNTVFCAINFLNAVLYTFAKMFPCFNLHYNSLVNQEPKVYGVEFPKQDLCYILYLKIKTTEIV